MQTDETEPAAATADNLTRGLVEALASLDWQFAVADKQLDVILRQLEEIDRQRDAIRTALDMARTHRH